MLDPSVHLLTRYRAFDHRTARVFIGRRSSTFNTSTAVQLELLKRSNTLKRASYWTLSEGESQHNRILPSVFQWLTTKLHTSFRVSSAFKGICQLALAAFVPHSFSRFWKSYRTKRWSPRHHPPPCLDGLKACRLSTLHAPRWHNTLVVM